MQYISRATLPLVFFFSSMASAAPTTQDEFFFKPYIGAAYNRYDISYNTVPSTAFNFGDFAEETLNGGQVHLGARIHQYLGVEASYFHAFKETKNGPSSITTSNYGNGLGLDVMGYYPISTTKIELIGTLGAAYTKYTGDSSSANFSVKTDEFKMRVGGGAQYWLSDTINIRGLLRYQDAEFAGKTAGTSNGTASDAIITTIGINWQF